MLSVNVPNLGFTGLIKASVYSTVYDVTSGITNRPNLNSSHGSGEYIVQCS